MPLKAKQTQKLSLFLLFHLGFGEPNQGMIVRKVAERYDGAEEGFPPCLVLTVFFSHALTMDILSVIRVCPLSP